MGITHAFAADITKAERDSNGDLIVYGKATGPDVDLDEQICDPDWLRSAMPSWMEWGNLREMHQPIAAGVGLELQEQGTDWMLRSKCVDESTAKKIEARVLRGYSVGIKNAKVVKDAQAPGGRIVGGEIVEVSYVDRPCNPTATLAIAKAVGADTALAPVEKADASDADPADDVVVPDDVIDETGMTGEDRDKAVALVKKAIGPDGQVDETSDIEGGHQAIALIARLIKAEADELAAGHLDEAFDISLLVIAVECLKCWLHREQTDDEAAGGAEGVTYVGLGAEPDITKGKYSAEQLRQMLKEGKAFRNPDGEPSYPIGDVEDLDRAINAVGRGGGSHDAIRAYIVRRAKALGKSGMIPDNWTSSGSNKTTEADLSKFVSKDDLDEVVKAAITKATEASEGRVKALEAELAKVKATPLPGGPVITATATRKQANVTDLETAAYYEAMADQVQDPRAATGYRQKAAQLRAAAGQSH